MIDDKPAFRFRLNGVIIPEIRIQRAMVNGEPVGDLQIAIRDETIGWFTIDDNSHLWDKHLSRFILEYRNETAWQQAEPIQRRTDSQKGWRKVSPRKLLSILEATGHIR
jgi:hypothetical protein